MKNKILAVLKNDTRLWQDKEFNQTLLIDLVEKYDKEVISILFEDEKLKQQFFVQVNNAWVFKVRDFVFFIEENKVNNSYTDYKNQIGLTDGKHFLKDTQDVVLDFPFKDCILEGGQSTDEGMDEFYQFDEKISAKDEKLGHKPNQYNLKQAKRKEVFFNQVLAKDEIDRLLDPKALTNAKRYTKEGISNEVVFTRDENGLIKDNLIIKGNNLLALHSLKNEFAGKVKLIYIDPPYNTGGDANIFTYNNTFNHSSWLTFMKNRLAVAKEFLRNDGVIAVAIDDCEQAYIKIICDEIFNEKNFMGTIIVRHFPGGRTNRGIFATTHEYCHYYAKNIESVEINSMPLNEDELAKKFNQSDEKGRYRLSQFARMGEGLSTPEERPNLHYPIYYSENENLFSLAKKTGYIKVIPMDSTGKLRVWRNSKDTFLRLVANDEIIAKNRNGKISLSRKVRETSGIKPQTIWYDGRYSAAKYGTALLKKYFDGENKFSFPKSLYTVLDTVNIITNKNDIVLDFFAGSGTTGHAVLELNQEDGGNRQFILVEQLDAHIEVSIERLKKVIDGSDQSEISKSINWQGGGEFVYFELAKWNEQAKEKINACTSIEELITLFKELCNQYFLNYNLKIEEFEKKVIKEDNFKNLELDKQKEMFLTMLDLNQMYVNKSEMADNKYGLSDADQESTKDFYGNK